MPPKKNQPKKTASAKARSLPPATRKSTRKPKKKPRNWKRWILPAVSLVLVVYAVIWVLGYYHGEQQRALHEPIRKHPATAHARILETSGSKSKRVHYEFLYKGIVYESWQSDYDGAFVLSRCYEVRLDSTNPARSFLVQGKPVDCD